MRNRRATLEGLSRILDAGAPEDLFSGPDDEAVFLYDLLLETGRARGSQYYWETCRTARRRGVTPEYVVDRALVLIGSMRERQRADLYRILGVPPLAAGDTIRQRWVEVAKQTHPDAGGDAASFRYLKEAYEILRDPERRAEYERFWLRALGPFERVASGEEPTLRLAVRPISPAVAERQVPPPAPTPTTAPTPSSAPEPAPAQATPVQPAAAETPPVEPTPVPAAPAPAEPASHGLLNAAARLFEGRAALDRKLAAVEGPALGGLSSLIGRLESALRAVNQEELRSLQAETKRVVTAFEAIKGELDTLATLRRRLRS